MNKKRNIIIGIILLIVLLVLLFYFNFKTNNNLIITDIKYVSHEENEKILYNGILKVTEILSNNKVKVKLDEINNEFIIYSSDLKVDDQLKISYDIDETIININAVENYNFSKTDKERILPKIKEDTKKYNDQIKLIIEDMKGSSWSPIRLHFIPIKISNQNYITMSSIDSIECFEKGSVYYGMSEKDKHKIEIDEKYSVINFEYIPYQNQKKYDINNPKKIEYKIEDNVINFKPMGFGLYELVVEIENGDIIKIIFK